VPVFAFGQNDTFHQPPSSLPSRFDDALFTKWPRLITKYSLLAFRDMRTFGVMPRRVPIAVVGQSRVVASLQRISFLPEDHQELRG
jgi:hypothetical protein